MPTGWMASRPLMMRGHVLLLQYRALALKHRRCFARRVRMAAWLTLHQLRRRSRLLDLTPFSPLADRLPANALNLPLSR
jgi:hypothetical protein